VARAHERTALPLGEELEALAHHYHHLQVEHQNAQPESSVRRRLEDKLLDVRHRFDRLLEGWVHGEEVRSAWRAYLDHHASRPGEPTLIDPLVFLGRADVSGTGIEVRRGHDPHEIWADGVLTARVDADKDFAVTEPGLRYRWNDNDHEELFAASDEGKDALATFLESADASPPWDHASELLADGLIDVHFALTPRGRRALGSS
jgi:hypothetical protein